LRDAQHPYPVDLKLTNGATHVSLKGTLTDPLTFGGADLKLELAGPDMRDLYHLTGIPIPETPAYRVSGQLDLRRPQIPLSRFPRRRRVERPPRHDRGGSRPGAADGHRRPRLDQGRSR
jgi:AsmA family protein